MKRKDLVVLIDKVVGSSSIMRASTWWVKHLFNRIIEYFESFAESVAKKEAKAVKLKVDTAISSTSTNPVQNKTIKEYVDKNKVNVDSSVSSSSTNPVQNRAIKAYVDNNKVSVDSSMSSTSTNPVQNKVVKQYVDSAVPTIDEEMSDTSSNPVQNQAVKKYIDTADKDIIAAALNDLDKRLKILEK